MDLLLSKERGTLYKANIFSLVSGNNTEFAGLFIESGLNLKFLFTGKQSKRQKQIKLSAEEIREALKSDYTAENFIRATVDEIRSDLPEDWGDGLVLMDAYIEDQYVCYKVQTDGSLLSIPLLRNMQSEGQSIEDSIIEEFNSASDPEILLYIRYLKSSGMGIKYIYWAKDNSDSVSFTVTPEMIKLNVKENRGY